MKWILLAIALALLITSCTGYVVHEDSVIIGANLAMTGKFAIYGINEQNAITLALEDLNEKNNKKIKLIVEDNQGEPAKAVTSMKKLIEIDDVDVLFSVFTHITKAVAPLAQNAEKILLYQSTFSEMAEENSYVFRDYYDSGESGRVLAEYALSRGDKKLVYVGEISDQCELVYQMASSVEEIVMLDKKTYDTEEKDFRTLLLKAKQHNPDAFIMCAWRHEDLIMKQMHELDMLDIQTYQLVAPMLPSSSTANPYFKLNKAVSSWYSYVKGREQGEVKAFVERYVERFGEEPLEDTVYVYDSFMFLGEAIHACGTPDADCLREYLLSREYEGLSGSIAYDAKGVANREVLLIQYGEDGWEEISRAS